jgi:hypothetical protein
MTRHVTFMTIDDAGHYSPEQRAAIVAAYPEHEREARAKGIPVLGSGRVFPVAEATVCRATGRGSARSTSAGTILRRRSSLPGIPKPTSSTSRSVIAPASRRQRSRRWR